MNFPSDQNNNTRNIKHEKPIGNVLIKIRHKEDILCCFYLTFVQNRKEPNNNR